MLRFVRGSAFNIAAVWIGRRFFLAGHISFVQVGLGVGADAEAVVRHLAVERWEVHCLLGLLEILLDEPDMFLGGSIGAR